MLNKALLLLHFLASVALTATLASLWETHRNLAAITALGVDIAPSERWATVLHDLLGFAPAFALLGGLALLLSLPVAALLAQRLEALRGPLYVLAGASSIAVMLLVMDQLLGITVIASARGAVGFAGLMACGALGTGLFAVLRRRAAAAW